MPEPDDVPLIRGVDLSAVQGDVTEDEWRGLAADGIAYAYLRLVVGNESWTDQRVASRNAARAREHGIRVGGYLFAYPLPHLDPAAQAERFAGVLEAIGSELPPAVDLEWPSRETRRQDGTIEATWAKWSCSAPQLRDWSLQCLALTTARVGRRALCYSFPYWLRCIEASKAPELGRYPLWLAARPAPGRWPTRAECERIEVPEPWTNIGIMQHDGDGGIRMRSGKDADYSVALIDPGVLV